ncbi:MAG: acyl-ACP--UDP-N-acetylglucosamine O-acyltransferase [Candidatus Krumholzibacteria bacterium]|nr:acyl-ACP--UDP-N-acetylglucosamine O-acyltransferase [Candidatus Krumholzibacteria bacterium]
MQERVNVARIGLRTKIHPTAIVHPWAKIGDGVKVGPYSVIGEHVELGDNCVIGPHVVIDGRTTIGRNNSFSHGAAIGTEPQDLRYERQVSYLQIGDDNTFREFTTVNVATRQGAKTIIGSRCYLMAYAHVAHDCVLGDNVILANSVNLAGFVTVDDYAIIGGVTPVHQFVRVGKHSFVGGGSRIERDIPPFVKVAGNPTRVYGINSVGLERRGFSQEKRMMIKSMFNVLYRNDLNVSQVLEQLKNGSFEDPERKILVDFLEACERGITK